jgi:Lrp/AsnC family leucine-responsive transcriptional regulator
MLQHDSRVAYATLGKAVGLSGPSVYARIQRLERTGTIRGYGAQLDPAALDQGLVAFIRISTQANIANDGPFERFVMTESQIVECHDVDGEDSYILKVRTSSPETLRALIAALRSLPGVTRTITSIALLTIKERGATGWLPDALTEGNAQVTDNHQEETR